MMIKLVIRGPDFMGPKQGPLFPTRAHWLLLPVEGLILIKLIEITYCALSFPRGI